MIINNIHKENNKKIKLHSTTLNYKISIKTTKNYKNYTFYKNVVFIKNSLSAIYKNVVNVVGVVAKIYVL